MGFAGRISDYISSKRLNVASGINASFKVRIPHFLQRLSGQQAQLPHLSVLDQNNRALGHILLGTTPLTIGRSGCAINIASATATIKGYKTTYKIPPEIVLITFNEDALSIRNTSSSNLIRVVYSGAEIIPSSTINTQNGGELVIKFMHPEIPEYVVSVLKTTLSVPNEPIAAFSGKPITWNLEGEDSVPAAAMPRSGRTWQATAIEAPAVIHEPPSPEIVPAPVTRLAEVFPLNLRLHLPISRVDISVFGEKKKAQESNYLPSANPRENNYFLTTDGKTLFRIAHGAPFTFGISGMTRNNLLLNFFPNEGSLSMRARTTATKETLDSNESFATPEQLTNYRIYVQIKTSTSLKALTFEVIYGLPRNFGPNVVINEASELTDLRI